MIRPMREQESQSGLAEIAPQLQNPWLEYQRQVTQLWGGIFNSWRFLLSGGRPNVISGPVDELPPSSFMPTVDLNVMQRDRETVLTAEIPGFADGEVNAEVKDGRVAIKAEKHQSSNGSEIHLAYHQTVDLPILSDAAEVQTTFRDGVLEMHIPMPDETTDQATSKKKPAKASPKRSRAPRKTASARTKPKNTKRKAQKTASRKRR